MLDKRLNAFATQLSDSPVQRITDPEWAEQGVELWIKRDDLLHSVVSGNKWRKLKWVLNHALCSGATQLVSMGGAYSNYLHALAYLAHELGLASHAYVRLDDESAMTPTLTDIAHWGMRITRVSRGEYRQLRQQAPELSVSDYWLPEGGAADLALRGVAELVSEIDQPFDVIACTCGTGATLAGLITALPESSQVLGVAALKHADFLYDGIKQLLGAGPYCHWLLDLDGHLGGFASVNPELLAFIAQFERDYAIPLEHVYTGKLLLALYKKLRAGYFAKGQRVLALHSGGLQGKRGLDQLI